MENQAKNEKVSLISLSLVDDFPEHPFMVKDDESMEQLIHSIEMNGILNPMLRCRISLCAKQIIFCG